MVATKMRNVKGCVNCSRIGKENATSQLATQLIKMPIVMALSRADNGNISAMMNQAIHPGPNAKKTITPVMETIDTCSAKSKPCGVSVNG